MTIMKSPPTTLSEEEMLDYLQFKGYEVTDDLDLFAKAQALDFEWDERLKRWNKGGIKNEQ